MAAEQKSDKNKLKRANSNLNGTSSAKRLNNKELNQPASVIKAVSCTGEGEPDNVKVQYFPTNNSYGILSGNENEVKLIKEKTTPRIKIPPITCFGIKQKDIHDSMRELEITKYNIKLLRNQGINIMCESIEDHEKVLQGLATNEKQYYTHDLPSQKVMRFVLKGLGNELSPTDVEEELKSKGINFTSVKLLNPDSTYHIFVVSFRKGEMSLNKIKETRYVYNTSIKWESYRNKRQGITTCARCQRPGHGARHCNMGFRCELCAENHETKTCPSNEQIKAKLSAITDAKDKRQIHRLEIPGKCCNCNLAGHFASDPNCPTTKRYVEKRNKKSQENRSNARNHFKFTPEMFPAIDGRVTTNQAATPARRVNNVSYAQCAQVLPSGLQAGSPELLRIPDVQKIVHKSELSPFFSVEETLQLLEEIRTKLPDVTKTPRNQAVPIIMQIAIKFLYGQDGCK